MSYSCLDHLAHMPTLDVLAICARDTVDRAMVDAHRVVAGSGTVGGAGPMILLGEALAGAIVLLRLAAFIHAVGRIAWRACRPILGRFRRAEPRTLVERHRGKPPRNGSGSAGGERGEAEGAPMA